MAKYMDEPYKSRAVKELQCILVKKGLPPPKHPSPLNLPPLAHPSFLRAVKRFLILFVRKHSDSMIPLHWPSSTVIEGKHTSIAKYLHNWKPAFVEWSSQPPVSCNCGDILKRFPDLPNQNGHIAGLLSSKFFPPELEGISQVCTGDAFYPSQQVFFRDADKAMQQWGNAGGIPTNLRKELLQEWKVFLKQHWPLHQAQLDLQPSHNIKVLQAIKQLLKGCIFHCEDHHTAKLCIFCPIRYFKMVIKTFTDGEVFKEVEASPAEIHDQIRQNYPKILQKRYPWGADFEKQFLHRLNLS